MTGFKQPHALLILTADAPIHTSGVQFDIPVSFSSTQQDKWHPLLSTVSNVQKYRWLKHSVQGVSSQSSLMATIVEFALKEEPLDVEKMRKCLLKQVIVKQIISAAFRSLRSIRIKSTFLHGEGVKPNRRCLFDCSWRGLK